MKTEASLSPPSESKNVCKATITTLFWTLLFEFCICLVKFSHNLMLTKLFVQLAKDTFGLYERDRVQLLFI